MSNEEVIVVVRYWGVRGSIAVSGGSFVQTGGHTTCVEVVHEGTRLVLDGGTGLQALGAALVRKDGPAQALCIAFSHLHWDHIQGVPFFVPAFHPGSALRLVGPPGLREALTRQMHPPQFPVGLDAMRGALTFEDPGPSGSFEVGSLRVTTRTMAHPDGVRVYRVEAGGRAVVFATDVEHGDGIDDALVSFADGADLLIHDAQYTDDEYAERRGWGHSTWAQAVAVAEAARVGQLALCHHDPGRTDDQVACIEAAAGQLRRGTVVAREGGQVTL